MPIEAADTADTSTPPISNRSTNANPASQFRWVRLIAFALLVTAIAYAATSSMTASSPETPANEKTSPKPASTALAQSPSEQVTKPVRVGVRRLGDIASPTQWLPFRGAVDPRRESTLAFRRSGRIEKIYVEAGDWVDPGTVLARLDISDLMVEADVADAELAVAKAASDEAEAGPRAQTIAAAQARVDQMAAMLKAAQLRESRLQKLTEQGASSLEPYQNEQQLVRQLTASVKEATQTLDELKAGTRSEQIASAVAQLAAAKASRAMIEVKKSDSLITAPYRCVVSDRLADEGSIVGPNQPIVTVIEEPPLEASFGLPSAWADRIEVGDHVALSVGLSDPPHEQPSASEPAESHTSELAQPDSSTSTYEGSATVVRLQPRVDRSTRTRKVVVEFPAKTTALVGRPATLWLSTKLANDSALANAKRNSYWLPSDSIVRGVRGLWGVYVVDTDDLPDDAATIRLHDVKVLETAGDMTRVATALPSTTLVVTSGSQRVGPGVAVDPSVDTNRIDTNRIDDSADADVGTAE